ncbi:MAG: EF-hand domain-containing protein [Pseudomonadota bacterium]
MTHRKSPSLFAAILLVHGLSACASPRFGGGMSGGEMSFENVDSNGDSSISLAEFVEKAPAMLRSPEDIFKRLDADGDGNISRQEFAARRTGRGRPR